MEISVLGHFFLPFFSLFSPTPCVCCRKLPRGSHQGCKNRSRRLAQGCSILELGCHALLAIYRWQANLGEKDERSKMWKNVSHGGFGPCWWPLGTLGVLLVGTSSNPARTNTGRRVQRGSSL